ncbi:MAG: NAD(P)/FAD-dependent oxidoreductase [Gemmatimonadetes bacterium]|nr:NAD(P)/FAD-dependent oxidoreductase [Gemmatimonadota bacterium]
MTRPFDTAVIGAGTNGLVAAIGLARAGSRVVVLEAGPAAGGVLETIEFAPGFRAAPLAPDLGWIPPDVIRGAGLALESLPPANPTVVALGSGESLSLRPAVAATSAELARLSRSDAERWPAFAGLLGMTAGFLGRLYTSPPPRIDADSIGEYFSLAKLGRSLRGLGKREMVEVLRTVPLSAAELLDDWFESDLLKGALAALAVADVSQGPMSGGTAFTLLHRLVGAAPGVVGERTRLAGGGPALVSALLDRARAAGVELRFAAPVTQILVKDDAVAGVVLGDGSEIPCREVVSSLDPTSTMLELLDPVHLDPEFIHAVKQIRYRGVTTKLLLGMDGLPEVPGVAGPVAGAVVIAPSVGYLEKAADASKYGRASDEPTVEIRWPSVSDPSLAPAGRHSAVVSVQYTPYRLREGNWADQASVVADRALGVIDRYLPGFSSRVMNRMVLTPMDLERRFGLREGAVAQGEMMLDQILFMRPVPGWSRSATPMPGLYWCGASTHPGGGVTGMSGWLAAQAVLAGRGRR